jgi:hypothetical protein
MAPAAETVKALAVPAVRVPAMSRLLLMLVVPVAAPKLRVVAAPPTFRVVAVVLNRLPVVWLVAIVPPLALMVPEAVIVVAPEIAPAEVMSSAAESRVKVPVALPMVVLAVPVVLMVVAPVMLVVPTTVRPPFRVERPVTVRVPPTVALLVTANTPALLRVNWSTPFFCSWRMLPLAPVLLMKILELVVASV